MKIHLYPFPFRTAKHFYLYDPGSNEIFMIDEKLFEVTTEIVESASPGFAWKKVQLPSGAYAELMDARNSGYLLDDVVDIPVAPDPDAFPCAFQRPSNLIIEITRECNLRCTYCTYSYPSDFRRQHGSGVASHAFLENAIDWFFLHEDCKKNKRISFYGGEPLLYTDRILFAIEYAKRQYPSFGNLEFGVTTNGTLLNLEVAKELIRHGVYLYISLDGDQDSHNWARVYATGGGTYQCVMSNLRAIWEHFGPLIRDRVFIIATLDPSTLGQAMFGWNQLIESERFLSEIPKIFNLISLDKKNPYVSRTVTNESSILSRILQEYICQRSKTNTDQSENIDAFFRGRLNRLHVRERQWIGNMDVCYGGGCNLFESPRLFLDLAGGFYPCERIDERFLLGRLEDDIDEKQIVHHMREWRTIAEATCTGCWAVRFCTRCFASVAGSSDILDSARQACRTNRDVWATYLVLYCSILEKNPNAFD